jgi:hypothetical protein
VDIQARNSLEAKMQFLMYCSWQCSKTVNATVKSEVVGPFLHIINAKMAAQQG